MKVKINPAQGFSVDEVRKGDTVVGKEPTEVSAAEGKALLQLQNKRGPLVVKVSKADASDNEEETPEVES